LSSQGSLTIAPCAEPFGARRSRPYNADRIRLWNPRVSTSSALPVAEAQPPDLAGPASGALWAWAALGLALVSAAAAFLHWDALIAAAVTWIRSPTYSYGMLVPPVVAWLIWRQRAALRQMAPRPWPWGLVLVGGAGLIATMGQVVAALVVEQLALVAMLQTAALTIVGPRVFRRLAFPLLYLYLAVPLGDNLIAPLQAFTARFAVGALELIGVPARLDGLLIQIPSTTFHVAEACAGLRFLLASFALGLLLAWLFFRSFWQRLLFVALSIALPIAGNGLRAAGVVLAAHWGDARAAAGFDHLTYGYFFTALLLACLVGLAAMLGVPRRAVADNSQSAGRLSAASGRGGRIAMTAAAALVATLLPALAARPAADQCPVAPILNPPQIVAPWAAASPAPDWRPVAANPDAELWQGYRRDGAAVDLYVGYYCAQRAGAEAVSQAHKLTGGGHWLVQGQGRDRLYASAGEIPVQTTEVGFAGQQRLVLVWYWVNGRFTADPLAAKLLQTKAAVLGGPPSAAVIVASTPFDGDASIARATIGDALVAMAPLEHVLLRPGGAAETLARD
jgi:exosortase A